MLRRCLPLLALLAGCSLMAKGTPVDIRYFSPESAAATAPRSPSTPAGHAAATLEIGRITSSASLRSRIAHRESAYEVGLYETRRWTDDPEVYVRRALTHELFDHGAFVHAVDGRHPILDVEVVAFEELRNGPAAAGRVALRYELHDEHAVLADGVVTATRPAAGSDFDAVVAAISAALAEATTELATVVGHAAPSRASTP